MGQTDSKLGTGLKSTGDFIWREGIQAYQILVYTKFLTGPFATFGDNNKVKEFEQNSNVAFTTIPHNGYEHVKAQGRVSKSLRSVFDLEEAFVSKIPDYKDTIKQVGQLLVLFEVKFDIATVTLDLENIDTIALV